MRWPVSAVADFFANKAFADWKKGREQEVKMQGALIERFDNLTKAIAEVVKR